MNGDMNLYKSFQTDETFNGVLKKDQFFLPLILFY